tara:strand:+ start:546 stop:863 length:318 start_codon:yes stop_codon:yes gene_type:complete
MKFFKILSCLLLFVFFVSCGAVKEGFSNQKKNNSDEFLVEKKSPLIMPPDFDELPIPKSLNKEDDKQENTFKELISVQDTDFSNTENSSSSKTLEKLLIEKINKN